MLNSFLASRGTDDEAVDGDVHDQENS
ncbi:hypothetical protein A2U01_0057526, partial [Trifolium medium]|nr:hypothetical protein [Trifolium medium]